MSSPPSTLELWGHWGAPNPFKVCIILEALKLPYKTHLLELSEVKQESYTKLNPNGRLPTLYDPNTGMTLWEVSNLRNHVDNVLNFNILTARSIDSPGQSFSISSISTTRRRRSRTILSLRSTSVSNGWRFRSQARTKRSFTTVR